eukprot:jgi/Hompol1/6716/HPOL_005055-RA
MHKCKIEQVIKPTEAAARDPELKKKVSSYFTAFSQKVSEVTNQGYTAATNLVAQSGGYDFVGATGLRPTTSDKFAQGMGSENAGAAAGQAATSGGSQPPLDWDDWKAPVDDTPMRSAPLGQAADLPTFGGPSSATVASVHVNPSIIPVHGGQAQNPQQHADDAWEDF